MTKGVREENVKAIATEKGRCQRNRKKKEDIKAYSLEFDEVIRNGISSWIPFHPPRRIYHKRERKRNSPLRREKRIIRGNNVEDLME